jgi:uncharacterized protein YqgQ
MESKITLIIKDPEIRRLFALERYKDIILMCSVSLVVRVLTIVAGLVDIYIEDQTYDKFYWAMRSACIGWHLLLLLLALKWPLIFSKCLGPLLLLGFIVFNLIPLVHIPITPHVTAANVTTLIFFLFHGIILNYSWIFTSISLFIVTLVTLVFYIEVIDFYDMTTITLIISLLILFVYTSYFCEKKLKEQFITLYQIKTMNNELTKLFDSLPEGIVLFNQETQKIALANTEFKRLFSVGHSDIFQDYANMEEKIE